MDAYTILMLMVALLFPQDTFFHPVRHCGLYALAEAISLEKDKEIQIVLIAGALAETDFGTDFLKYQNSSFYVPNSKTKFCGVYNHLWRIKEKCNNEDYALHTKWLARSIDKYGLAKRYRSYIQKVKETIRKTAKKSFYKEYKKCD